MEAVCSSKMSADFNGLHGVISQKTELLVTVLIDDCLPALCEVMHTCEQVPPVCMPDSLDHFCRLLIGAARAFPLVGAFFLEADRSPVNWCQDFMGGAEALSTHTFP
jgi:hypothetical protein